MTEKPQSVISDRVPIGGHVLAGTVRLLPGLEATFNPQSDAFRHLQAAYIGSGSLFSDATFIKSPVSIHHFQMLMAALMTYHGGIQCVKVQEFTVQVPVVRLFWEGKKYASFQVGEMNESLKQFVVDVQRLILKIDRPQPDFLKVGLKSVVATLQSYHSQVSLLGRNFDKLITAIQAPRFSVRELAEELMFILLSTLPVADINAFFLDIHSYFPPDLEITLANGNRVNVGSYFEKTAQDTSYLIDKIKVFATLFYSQTMPVIQEIAQGRGAAFLQKLMDHPGTRATMIQHLIDARDLQIQPRVDLYQFLTTHLRTLGISA